MKASSATAGRDPAYSPRDVITFYSYKGGTGRTMALANAAVLLAQRCVAPTATLMIDFDLEAPGLHRYFPQRADGVLMADAQRPGLIDVVTRVEQATRELTSLSPDERAAKVRDVVNGIDLEEYICDTSVPQLSLLKAGRLDQSYASLVNGFRWNEFYQRAPSAIRLIIERIPPRFRYVLIDSRTGTTDTSDICTMLLPAKLVLVFTPNLQSLEGITDLIKRAVAFRESSDDIRPFVIYPLPSRIETTEPAEKEAWRLGEAKRQLQGWQPTFEQTIREAYGLKECALEKYFDEVQIQHQGYYAYGEKIAVLLERGTDVVSLPRRYERFVEWLVDRSSPWEDPALAAAAARRRQAQVLGSAAERAFLSLDADEQQAAERFFLRFVRVLGDKDVGDISRRLVSLKTDFAPDDAVIARVAEAFIDAGFVVNVDAQKVDARRHAPSNPSVQRPAANPPPEVDNQFQIADELLVEGWYRLADWIGVAREFLVWRQRLEVHLDAWLESGKNPNLILSPSASREAKRWLDSMPGRLSPEEQQFIRLGNAMWPGQTAPATTKVRRWAVGGVGFAIAIALAIALAFVKLRPDSRSNPAEVALLLTAADVALAAGHPDSARAWVDSAESAAGATAQTWTRRGEIALALGQRSVADSAFAGALRVDSTLVRAWIGRAKTNLARGDTNSALTAATRAVDLAPASVDARVQRSEILAARSKSAAAVVDLDSALRYAPNRSSLYFQRGELNQRTNNRAAAINDYRSAAQYAPDSVVRLAAQARLRALGASAVASATLPTVVPIQYSTPRDSATAWGLYSALRKRGIRVLTPELKPVQSTGELRYFRAEDRDAAMELQQIVETGLAQLGIVARLRPALVRVSGRAAPGQVELWLPVFK